MDITEKINKEQEWYRKRYKNYLVGFLFNHPDFHIARYLYHLRKAEQHTGKNIFLFFHKSRMNFHSFRVGLQIGLNTCAPGIRIYHWGTIIINGAARIGENLHIYPGVTIGQSGGDVKRVPTIGNNVWIFSNAMVQGDIKVGDYAVIAPNSVVTHDVPAYSIVGGIPAKEIGQVSH